MIEPLGELVRTEAGQVLAGLIRMTGDIDLAEDAVQDAVLAALESWPRLGIPANPGGWLTTTARNKALDRIRRESRRADKEHAAHGLVEEWPTGDAHVVRDDILRLIFTCCHPALGPEAQVALTLRTVCGLTTPEIAAVFLVSDPTMGQRISRAKRKIALAQIPYRVPPEHELPDRLDAALSVIHAIFTAGHHPAGGPVTARVDLALEAIRLARLLVDLLPGEPEVQGLLALLLASHARWPARVDEAGDLVLLADQDRSRWERSAVDEACALVDDALRRQRPGRFQLQAAIACVHSSAPTYETTDWTEIALLYRALEQVEPTAVVRVNRAVAEAELGGPDVGLALLGGLDGVDDWHLYWATKADLLHRRGDLDAAATALRHALACRCNDADRRLLERRLAEVSNQAGE